MSYPFSIDNNFEQTNVTKYIYNKSAFVSNTSVIDLTELKYKGEKVPVKFYDMISRYLPPEEEESYRGDPVEYAVMNALTDLNSKLKYLNLYLTTVRINPYSRG